jgi:ATP-dependent RNA helicase DHX29
VLVLDGNRARFSVPDWKAMLVLKVLRARLRETLTRAFRNPGRLPSPQQERWMEVWQRVFSLAWEGRVRERAVAGAGAGGGGGTGTGER